MIQFSPYEVLEIELGATEKSIRKRYKQLIREFTPENHPEKFMEIRAAYDALLNSPLEKIDKFPIYRKPLINLEIVLKDKNNNKPEPTLLGVVFETPYNTNFELKKMLKTNRVIK